MYDSFATSWTVACQVPLSMGFPRQEYWSGLPIPSPGDLSDPGTELMSLVSLALAGGFFTTGALWEVSRPPSDQISCSVVSDSLRPHGR